MSVSRRQGVARLEGAPREPGAWGLALGAAQELVDLATTARRLEWQRRARWGEARQMLAAVLRQEGLDLTRRRADFMLREAVQARMPVDDDGDGLTPAFVWGAPPAFPLTGPGSELSAAHWRVRAR